MAQIADSITAGMDAQEAIDRPRLHCEGETVVCDQRMDDVAIAALRTAGESVEVIEETTLTWHFARPPVVGLEYEMDCRGVAKESVID